MQLNAVVFDVADQLPGSPTDKRLLFGSLELNREIMVSRYEANALSLRENISEAQRADVVVLGPCPELYLTLSQAASASGLQSTPTTQRQEGEPREAAPLPGKRRLRPLTPSGLRGESKVEARLNRGPLNPGHDHSLFRAEEDRQRLVVVIVPQIELANRPGNPMEVRNRFCFREQSNRVADLLQDLPPLPGSDLGKWFGKDWPTGQRPRTSAYLTLSRHRALDRKGQRVGMWASLDTGVELVFIAQSLYEEERGSALAGVVSNFAGSLKSTSRVDAANWQMVQQKIKSKTQGQSLVGSSRAWRNCLISTYKAAKMGGTSSPDQNHHVFLEGPTGSGKELIAQQIHALSGRAGKLYAVNCASLRGQTFMSELFGHRKGAFTGAFEDRTGLLKEADGGTFFLDECQELLEQSEVLHALLRFLEDNKVRRLGDEKSVQVNVRVVAACNDRGLLAPDSRLMSSGFIPRFRTVIHLPSLLERWSDVADLTRHYSVRQFKDVQVALDSPRVERVIANADARSVQSMGVRAVLAAVEREFADLKFQQERQEWKDKQISPSEGKKRKGASKFEIPDDGDLLNRLQVLADADDSEFSVIWPTFPYKKKPSLKKRIRDYVSDPKIKLECQELLEKVWGRVKMHGLAT